MNNTEHIPAIKQWLVDFRNPAAPNKALHLVGPERSGKTTLTKALSTLLDRKIVHLPETEIAPENFEVFTKSLLVIDGAKMFDGNLSQFFMLLVDQSYYRRLWTDTIFQPQNKLPFVIVSSEPGTLGVDLHRRVVELRMKATSPFLRECDALSEWATALNGLVC